MILLYNVISPYDANRKKRVGGWGGGVRVCACGGGVGKGEKGREGGRLAVDIYAAGATFFVPYSDRGRAVPIRYEGFQR